MTGDAGDTNDSNNFFQEESMRLVSRRLLTAGTALALALTAGCGEDTVDPTPQPPAVPAGLTATVQSPTLIRVSWTPVAGATSYRLERADASAPGVFTQVGGVLPQTTYDDAVTAGVTYSYRVAASNVDGTGSFSAAVTAAAPGLKVADLTGIITTSRTLFKDTLYTLKGYVKVANNASLTIQPGTRIVGDFDTKGSSLWILRGSKLIADGSAAEPIVFTSEQPVGQRKPGDWGGILIIGNGVSSRSGTIRTEGPQGVTEIYSGGNNNNDDSGILRYVRIEFAGYDVTGTGQELNSLSSYAVGKGTTYEFIQTLAGLDDSFEWWGGAVDGRFLVSYESGDDHFDWTEGYHGRNQYLIGFQSARIQPAAGTGGLSTDPQGFEGDGCPSGEAGCDNGNSQQPFSVPVFANFTLIGPGNATAITSGGDIGMVIRRGTGGYFTHGIVARWQRQGLSVRDAFTNTQLTATDSLNIVNMLFAENAANYDADASANFGKAAVFTTENHVTSGATAASLFTSLTATALDWSPAGGSPAGTVTNPVGIPAGYTAAFFGGTLTPGGHFGAAAAGGTKWWQGWTSYAQN